MSFVIDHVHRIDAHLDRLQLWTIQDWTHDHSEPPSEGEEQDRAAVKSLDDRSEDLDTLIQADPAAGARIDSLQSLIKSLNAIKSGTLTRDKVSRVLAQTQVPAKGVVAQADGKLGSYENELCWIFLNKATFYTCGLLLSTVLDQTVPLSSDIWYWDEVLGSARWTGLYSLQTAPGRVWARFNELMHEVRQRQAEGIVAEFERTRARADTSWREFYGLVSQVIQQRSVSSIRQHVLSPVILVREEAREKRACLHRLKTMGANALGLLLGEGLSQGSLGEDEMPQTQPELLNTPNIRQKWRTGSLKCLNLMEAVLQAGIDEDMELDKFDDAVASAANELSRRHSGESDDSSGAKSFSNPYRAIGDLRRILDEQLPLYVANFDDAVKRNGRPRFIVRYWIAGLGLLVSSSTILRIVLNRKAEIITWVREFGATVMDFWSNWVVEPSRKVIGTIRHDEGSEISIMSKRSLEGDRDSLERMVIDFALDTEGGSRLSDTEVTDLRTKVHEGDLTPVLKVYEKEMQSPFMGAIRGSLIRALLIQVQKTKVDVEVAVGGIDAMLKSQELVFGFVGLTPGILVCIGVGRWLSGALSNKKGLRKGERQGELVRTLRNVDRILTGAVPTNFGELYYRDQGLLLCEVHVFRQSAKQIFPKRVFHELVEDLEELVDIRTGVEKQRRVLERIRWAYTQWIR